MSPHVCVYLQDSHEMSALLEEDLNVDTDDADDARDGLQ